MVENIADMVVEIEVEEVLYKEVKGVVENKLAVEAGLDEMVVGEGVAEMGEEEMFVERMAGVVVNCSVDLVEVVAGNLVGVEVEHERSVLEAAEKVVVVEAVEKTVVE